MITSLKMYKQYMDADRKKNNIFSKKDMLRKMIFNEQEYRIWKYIKLLRKDEYFTNKKGIFSKLLKIYYRRKKNYYGEHLGITIPPNVFESGLCIWHYGTIIVNGYARVGENCILHGNNCIGNDGKSLGAPKIGKNVDVGVGATIIGEVEIADDIKIGANSVVIHSFKEKGITIAGIPAKKVK